MVEKNIYKILRTNEWEEASLTGSILSEVDTKDGFIHLSTAVQLAATLSFFFKDSETVFLLQLDMEKIDINRLIYEEPYPNDGLRKGSFPHLYCELTTDQISMMWTIERGAFSLPQEVILQAENLT
ncbi:MAG: DUF952 domain-containing protein [SAR86 cluster bacterium]|jgi:uncharacterized protein (DUF952 family)|nr:DUF952 domain-containing protein [SAR86 cluster bacterium]|tara:strand:- start:94 stop:471 length:378 start_codon:yes stop_codon:yes gene_type:complete